MPGKNSRRGSERKGGKTLRRAAQERTVAQGTEAAVEAGAMVRSGWVLNML